MDIKRYSVLIDDEEGSSLIAVLITITIISFLVGMVMMAMVIQNRFIQRDVKKLQARYSAEAGIFHFLADSTLSINTSLDSLEISLMDSTKANIEAKPFGGFLYVSSKAKSGEQTKTIRTLVGTRVTPEFENAVVLGDLSSALHVTGTTTINGDLALGSQGVRMESLKGKLFEGTLRGTAHKSDKPTLPKFDNTLYQNEIANFDSILKDPPDTAVELDTGRVNRAFLQDLTENGIYYIDGNLDIAPSTKIRLPESITLIVTGTLEFNGPIAFEPFSQFIAGDKLKVFGDVEGRHGIFYGRQKIEIKAAKEFSGQFIAGREAIILGKSYLKYPSVVYVEGSLDEGTRKGRLELSENSIIDGMLLMPASNKVVTNDKSRLVVSKESTVRGAIYNAGKTELLGRVLGSVLTFQFYFYQSPTAYINWLKNVIINVDQRPDKFVVPIGFSEKRKFEIIEWEEN